MVETSKIEGVAPFELIIILMHLNTIYRIPAATAFVSREMFALKRRLRWHQPLPLFLEAWDRLQYRCSSPTPLILRNVLLEWFD